MAITINGTANTVAGLAVGGVPDGSIDRDAVAADLIDGTKIADDAVAAEHVADDAVGVAQLSATGTASSSTFLRGDNSWAAVTAPSGWEKVTRSTGLSGDQDIENTSLFDGTYNQIMICLESCVLAADHSDIGVLFKADGSWITSANYMFAGQQRVSDSSNLTELRSTGAARFEVITGVGNAAGEWVSGKIFINEPNSTNKFKNATWEFWGITNSGHTINSYGAGTQGSSDSLDNALEGVRFYGRNGGNLGTSTISAYGLKL